MGSITYPSRDWDEQKVAEILKRLAHLEDNLKKLYKRLKILEDLKARLQS